MGGSPEGVVSFIELVGVYMINRISFSLLSILLFSSNNVNAAFPDDFEGVILEATSDEAGIRNFAVTATLDFSSSGGFLVLDSDKASVWPERSVFGTAINANAWVFAKFDDQWHGHTFDYMRPGQIAKSTGALNQSHFSGLPWVPFFNYDTTGAIYGFMVSGLVRLGSSQVNVAERSNIVWWKWNVGPVDECEAVPESPNCGSRVSVAIDLDSVIEGDGAGAATAIVSRNTGTSLPLEVTLVSNDTTEATVPATVMIAAGERDSAPFNIDAVEDDVLDGTQTVKITASAAAHADGSDSLDVHDNDYDLTVHISAASISEAVGEAATTATVSRNTDTAFALAVALVSNDITEATVPASILIAAGRSISAPFNIDAVDDDLIDGTQTVTIMASAFAHADATDTIDVRDNDVLGITIVIDRDSVSENSGEGAATATVSRNTDTSLPLAVTLVSNDATEATVPSTVLIDAGQSTSAPFNIDSIDDTLIDGTQTVKITASAFAHEEGADTLDVTDDDDTQFYVLPTLNGGAVVFSL